MSIYCFHFTVLFDTRLVKMYLLQRTEYLRCLWSEHWSVWFYWCD